MPKGPKGQKRPADVVSNAALVMRIATGQEHEPTAQPSDKNPAAVSLGRLGGVARAKALSAKKLGIIARDAAKSRWGRK